MTGEPHTALTAFRRRQVLARQGGGAAGPQDLGRPGFAFWRRAGAQRRQRAEAEAGQARQAVLEADARLAAALAAKAAAEQEAAAARARVADIQRAAEERVAAAQQERDEAAGSARAELDQARQDADRQLAQVREDAARDQAGLRAALEARIAAAEARDGFQARTEHAEAELQRARADRDQLGDGERRATAFPLDLRCREHARRIR